MSCNSATKEIRNHNTWKVLDNDHWRKTKLKFWTLITPEQHKINHKASDEETNCNIFMVSKMPVLFIVSAAINSIRTK